MFGGRRVWGGADRGNLGASPIVHFLCHPEAEMPRGRGAPPGDKERGGQGGVRLPPEMVRLARSIDSPGGAEEDNPPSGVRELVGRIESRAAYELSCYVRACMMRTGFA